MAKRAPKRAERRKYPRVHTEALMSIAPLGERGVLSSGLDLSLGGVRFQVFGLELDVGQTIRVTLNLADETVEIVGEIVRVTDVDGFTQEVALAFTEVGDDARRLLAEHLPEAFDS